MAQAKELKRANQKLVQNKEIQDLLDKIHFDTQHGQIWFEENRMLLMHTSMLGFLRKDLHQMLGLERTKHFSFVVAIKQACVMLKSLQDFDQI